MVRAEARGALRGSSAAAVFCSLLAALLLPCVSCCAGGGQGPGASSVAVGLPATTGPGSDQVLPPLTNKLISRLEYNTATQTLVFAVASSERRAVLVTLQAPAELSSSAGLSFSFPTGSGAAETSLRCALCDGQTSQLNVLATAAGGQSDGASLAIPHPRLDFTAVYNDQFNRLTLSARHPYGEPVSAQLSPSPSLSLQGPLSYVFNSGAGSYSYSVAFSDSAPTDGSIRIDVTAPHCAPLQLLCKVLRRPLISDVQWLLPENELQVSLDNGYDEGSGWPLSLRCQTPSGISVDGSAQYTVAGPVTTLKFKLAFQAGPLASYNVQLQASDDHQHNQSLTVPVSRENPVLPDNSLFAYPLTNHVKVGEPVDFVVASGRTDAPLLFMTGVALAYPPDGSFVSGSFNLGSPGGNADQEDGLWLGCRPQGGYVLGLDPTRSQPQALLAGDKMLVCNVTPLAGQALHDARGDLFNLSLSFDKPGRYSLDFVDSFKKLPQTYYQNADGTVHYWDSTGNSAPGVPREVVVEE